MAKRPDPSRSTKLKRQIRGTTLEKRIEAAIRELALAAQATDSQYVYNASRVAKEVPCTRKTLARHDAIIEKVLAELASRRRMVTGEAIAELLRDQVARLKEKLAKRDKVIQSLRAAHVEIYTRFHNHSLPAELLIRAILETECVDAGRCIFCGSTLTNSNSPFKHSGNVVEIKGERPHARR
ncbi:MAG: hypothetical protein EPN38_08245 [Rhodanobacteraceae bacterium]|nr:MAG: hypothetical protein EPN38_08245 [Rhodanobacteraceae bacterium]